MTVLLSCVSMTCISSQNLCPSHSYRLSWFSAWTEEGREDIAGSKKRHTAPHLCAHAHAANAFGSRL